MTNCQRAKMEPHDSDSSLSDFSEDYGGISTNTLLGYATKDPSEDLTSHIGGEPTWLVPSTSPSAAPQAPSAHYAHCESCHSHMPLLLQLNGDMPDRFPDHERRLYVFGCRKKGCRRKEGSVRALRGVKIVPGASSSQKRVLHAQTSGESKQEVATALNESGEKKRDIGAALFGGNEVHGQGRQRESTNPFSMSTKSSSGSATSESKPFLRPSPNSKPNPFSKLPNSSSTLVAKPTQNKPVDSSPLANNSSPESKTFTRPEADLSTTFAEKARLASPDESRGTTTHQSNIPLSHPKQEYIPWPSSTSTSNTPFGHDTLPKPYPRYYLDAEYEYLDTPTADTSGPSKHHAAFLDADETREVDMDTDDDPLVAGGNSGARKPNKSPNKSKSKGKTMDTDSKEDAALKDSHIDRTFQHFADTLSQNPEQALRYEFDGKPLLYSRTDAVGRLFSQHRDNNDESTSASARATNLRSSKNLTTTIPSPSAPLGPPQCPHCSSPRIFEFQITPHAIAELESEQDAAMILREGMEWGTVVVCVCGSDCLGSGSGDEGKVNYVEEWVGVQWEEVMPKGRGS